MRIGVIGCGGISGAYLSHAPQYEVLEVVACADLIPERAQKSAQEYNVPTACSVDELLADESIELVVNLTLPQSHAQIALAAIEAGKHVYSEKPLGINRREGRQVIETARARGLRVGNAPDTFLGAGHQTARKLIDEGAIGRPVAAAACMLNRGHEHWHHNPQFYYEPGGGPLFDMGPYYVTDLMQLLGPVKRVTGSAVVAIPQRTITSEPLNGTTFQVQTPDHVSGTLEFESGCVATIIMSFAVIYHDFWPITIFGTEGTMRVLDPNGFDGPISVRRKGDEDWQQVEQNHCLGYSRAVGVADMAHAIATGRAHRANGDRAFAVLDVMQGVLDAGATGRAVDMQPGYERPAPLPTGLPEGVLDD